MRELPTRERPGPITHRMEWRRPAAAWWAAALILALHGTLAWMGRGVGIVTFHDDARYILLSRALKEFHYRELWRLDAPVHSMYPPGYPALLALWSEIGGYGFDWLVLLSALASVAALGFTFAAVKRITTPALALASVAILAVNPYLLPWAGYVMSDAPFLALTAVALWAVAGDRRGRRWLWIAGAAAIAAALTRSIGVLLVAGLGLAWLSERRYRAVALLALAALLTKGGWILWTLVAPEQFEGGSYVGDFAALVGSERTFAELVQLRLRRVFVHFLPLTLPFPAVAGTSLDNLIGIGLVLIGGTAGLLRLAPRWRAAALYVPLTILVLMFWRWTLGRYFVPLLLVVVPAVLWGVHHLADRIHRRLAQSAVAVLALLLFGTGAAGTVRNLRAMPGCERDVAPLAAECIGPERARFFEAVRFIGTNTPEDAVVLTGRPATLSHYTGRRTLSPDAAVRVGEPAAFLERLRANGTQHIVLSGVHPIEWRGIAPRLESICDSLRLEARFPPDAFVFSVVPPGAGPADASACEEIRAYRALLYARRGDEPLE